ncbi:MAG: peptidase prolyl oligopeptidase active site domain protein, partial [Actinomycetia bacterium]|nr:peptidase prolyl oligopeptidase active site domain protein [Actinomycetes bacterium]
MTVAAPFGTWRSPISAEMVAAGDVSLMQPHLHEGVAYWLEGRPAEGGRSVLVRADAFSEPTDVTPPGFNVRTTVHEYGGGAYLLHDGVVYFSNFADQRMYRQDAGGDP